MKRLIHLFLCLSLAVHVSAGEIERILSFHSDIQVDTTGRVVVSEQIKVYANGDDIKRGIVRSLPVYRKDVYDKNQKIQFDVLSVKRDNQPENYTMEEAGSLWDIYIGRSDVILKPGIYTFTIVYETFGQVGFFDTYDEIYWNVTGNDWQFPIEEASATITFPEGIAPINNSCYTGLYGSTASDCISEVRNHEVYFKTTTPLRNKEGLSVAVSFPRDIIRRPPPPSAAKLFWMKYRHIILPVVSLLLMFIYGFLSWRRVGKDPEIPIIIPQFNPPNQWSPGIIRYLYKRKCDNKTFTTILVSMAVKGAIRIKQEGKKYILSVVNRDIPMEEEEKNLLNKLFSSSKTIQVSDSNHSTFSRAFSSLESTLKIKKNLKDYFLKNIGYIVLGAFLVIVLLLINISLSGVSEAVFTMLFTSPFILSGLFVMIVSLKQPGCSKIIMFLFGLVFFTVGMSVLVRTLFIENSLTVIFIILSILLFALYVYLIKAPTELGAKTISELEGFRMYLKTAEENRLNLLTPPEHTPELFEKMLPYAIALDVENEWGKKFDGILERANYEPEWYNGSEAFHPGSFTGSFANSFTSSVQRAQVDPTASSGSSGSGGWSSGSSGGGFSGGGGGGGGGRGW